MSKKGRNRFLAFCCLVAFGALGFLYYSNWVVQKPFAIVLVISDNLTPSTLTAARVYGVGSDGRLAMERLPHLGLLSTYAADFALSDTAASSTALATGRKTNNGSVGMNADKQALTTLAEHACLVGRSVGLVTNTSLADIGPAAFYAKIERHDRAEAALQFVDAISRFDVLLGGGAVDFRSEARGGKQNDDLVERIAAKKITFLRNKKDLLSATPYEMPAPLVGIFADDALAFSDEVATAASQPTLAEMVAQAMKYLQTNRRGYLLIVDAGLPRYAASNNQGERMLRELLQVDSAVSTALSYAGDSVLLVVAGRGNLGGLRRNGYPFRKDKGMAVVGKSVQEIPSLTWSTGPGNNTAADATAEPSAFKLPAATGVLEDPLVFATGMGGEKLNGMRDNTDVFRAIYSEL